MEMVGANSRVFRVSSDLTPGEGAAATEAEDLPTHPYNQTMNLQQTILRYLESGHEVTLAQLSALIRTEDQLRKTPTADIKRNVLGLVASGQAQTSAVHGMTYYRSANP